MDILEFKKMLYCDSNLYYEYHRPVWDIMRRLEEDIENYIDDPFSLWLSFDRVKCDIDGILEIMREDLPDFTYLKMVSNVIKELKKRYENN